MLKNVKKSLAAKTNYLEKSLSLLSSLKILGNEKKERCYGPVPFVAYTKKGKEIPSMAVAACLSYFHGIQLRANHLCAPVLIHQLKGISNADANKLMFMFDKDDNDKCHLSDQLVFPDDPHSALHVVRPSISFLQLKKI